MQAAIEGIITELRQIGVPVSLAERIDAVHSLEYLPLSERATVKSALRAALIKNHDHELAFDALFDLYFTPPEPPPRAKPSWTRTPSRTATPVARRRAQPRRRRGVRLRRRRIRSTRCPG